MSMAHRVDSIVPWLTTFFVAPFGNRKSINALDNHYVKVCVEITVLPDPAGQRHCHRDKKHHATMHDEPD